MTRLKIFIAACGLAFMANNISFLLLLGAGIVSQWFFVKPLMDFALNIKPSWLGIAAFYMVGFSQFFIIFFVVILIAIHLKKKRPPTI